MTSSSSGASTNWSWRRFCNGRHWSRQTALKIIRELRGSNGHWPSPDSQSGLTAAISSGIKSLKQKLTAGKLKRWRVSILPLARPAPRRCRGAGLRVGWGGGGRARCASVLSKWRNRTGRARRSCTLPAAAFHMVLDERDWGRRDPVQDRRWAAPSRRRAEDRIYLAFRKSVESWSWTCGQSWQTSCRQRLPRQSARLAIHPRCRHDASVHPVGRWLPAPAAARQPAPRFPFALLSWRGAMLPRTRDGLVSAVRRLSA